MRLVTSIHEIEENLGVLLLAIAEGDDDAIDLVKKGQSFVVANNGGKLVFGPSRYLGYQGNNIDRHNKMRKRKIPGGTETSDAIRKVIGEERSYASVESEFLRYCSGLGVTPSEKKKNPRRYWILPDAIELVYLEALEHGSTVSNTEKTRLQKVRLGQGLFRDKLEEKWGDCCCITGCKIPAALRASHIKPWKDCNNKERLDKENGLLLVANMDALFDRGFISFAKDGSLLRSELISVNDLEMLAGRKAAKIRITPKRFTPKLAGYMQFHRKLHGF